MALRTFLPRRYLNDLWQATWHLHFAIHILIWISYLVLKNDSKCLWLWVSSKIVLPKFSDWNWWVLFLVMFISSDFLSLNSIFHLFAHCMICSRSLFKISARMCGFSKHKYILVSSAKSFPFSSERLCFVDTVLWLCPSTINDRNLKMTLIAAYLNAGLSHSGRWWQCNGRYIISLFPHRCPSLISLEASEDVKHHGRMKAANTLTVRGEVKGRGVATEHRVIPPFTSIWRRRKYYSTPLVDVVADPRADKWGRLGKHGA